MHKRAQWFVTSLSLVRAMRNGAFQDRVDVNTTNGDSKNLATFACRETCPGPYTSIVDSEECNDAWKQIYATTNCDGTKWNVQINDADQDWNGPQGCHRWCGPDGSCHWSLNYGKGMHKDQFKTGCGGGYSNTLVCKNYKGYATFYCRTMCPDGFEPILNKEQCHAAIPTLFGDECKNKWDGALRADRDTEHRAPYGCSAWSGAQKMHLSISNDWTGVDGCGGVYTNYVICKAPEP